MRNNLIFHQGCDRSGCGIKVMAEHGDKNHKYHFMVTDRICDMIVSALIFYSRSIMLRSDHFEVCCHADLYHLLQVDNAVEFVLETCGILNTIPEVCAIEYVDGHIK